MYRLRLRFLHKLPGLCRLTTGLCLAGLPLAGLGCASDSRVTPQAVARAVAGETETLPQQSDSPPAQVIQTLPDPEEDHPSPQRAAKAAHQPVPVSMDTVLRITQDQNAQVNVARERVREAFAEKDVADKRWLPDVYLGTSYYRHEGGIQNEDGTVTQSSFGSMFGGMEINTQLDIREYAYQKVNAERKIWQQRGELSRVSSETLLDATNTYLDLLAAYQGASVIRATDKQIKELLQLTEGLAKTDRVYDTEVSRIKAELANREEMFLKLREQGDSARAKLAYLLGLSPDCEMVPVDNRLGILHLVDASVPVCNLVAQALSSGPGIREMEGLLNLIQESIEKSKGLGKYMPVLGVRMAEGIFGAGPGSRSDWDNRWDLGLQARWNLTEAFTARDRQRVTQARFNQAHLSYQDLRNKLTAGVEEARNAIVSGQQQFPYAEEQIKEAKTTVDLSLRRFRIVEAANKSPSDALLAIRTQMGAQLSYLGVIRDYDKAQFRLLVLTGQIGSDNGHCNGH